MENQRRGCQKKAILRPLRQRCSLASRSCASLREPGFRSPASGATAEGATVAFRLRPQSGAHPPVHTTNSERTLGVESGRTLTQSVCQAPAAGWRTRGFSNFVDIFLRKTESKVMILAMTNSTAESSVAESPATAPWRPGGRKEGCIRLRHSAYCLRHDPDFFYLNRP
jgi:hypothetical protein